MNILTAFTLKTMKTYRKWSVVTILGVVLSTTLLTGVVALTVSGIALLKEQQLASFGKWTASITNGLRKDAAYWEAKEPGDQVSIIKEFGFANLKGSENKGKPYIQVSELDGVAIENFFVVPTAGRLPVNEKEIILPENIQWTSGRNIEIGDTITLDLGKRKLPDGRYILENTLFHESFFPYIENMNSSTDELTPVDQENYAKDLGPETLEITEKRTYTIVGFMNTPIGEDSWSAGYRGFTVPSDSLSVTDEDDIVTLYIWTESPNWIYMQNTLEQGSTLGYNPEDIRFNTDYLNLLGISSSFGYVNVIYIGISFLISIIVVSSFFLIFNSFAISVSERRRHLALFATAGATRSQKRAYIFREGLIVGIIGIPLGMLVGLFIVQTLFVFAEPAFLTIGDWNELKLQMMISPESIVLIILLEVFTIFFSVLIPSFKASRIMPIDAIRQTGATKIGKKSRTFPAAFVKLFGIETVLAIKNLRRNRGRYRATTFSLVIGLILFLSVSSVSAYTSLWSDFSSIPNSADITLNIEGVSPAAIQLLYDQIRNIDDIDEVNYFRQSALQLFIDDSKISDESKEYMERYSLDSLTLFLYVYDDVYFDNYAKSVGADPADFKDPLNPSGILINRAEDYDNTDDSKIIGNILNIDEGEILKGIFYSSDLFFTQSDSLDWDKSPLPERNYYHVNRITNQMPLGVSSTYFGGVYLVVPESIFLDSIAGTSEEKESADNTPTFHIQTANSHDVERSIRELCEMLPSSQITLFNQTAEKERENQLAFIINLIAFGFITLIGLISLANLFNTITTTTALRQKEYAMLRSVGMTTKSFHRMIRLESFFLGSSVLFFGVPISIGISLAIFMIQGYNYYFDFMVPWKNYFAAVLIVFSLIFFTMLYSISRINRQNIIDALKSDSE